MLYIIRHGLTDWNIRHKLQGQTDVPLNEDGRTMARVAKTEYKDINFDICFCSPLVRAKETATILLEGRDIPIIEDERLKEMCFGDYEGIENSFDIPDCPVNVLFKEPEKYVAVHGGESIADVIKRTGEFLQEKVNPLLDEGRDVLIVGHGAMNSCIVCQVKGLQVKDLWSLGIENCKLMKLK